MHNEGHYADCCAFAYKAPQRTDKEILTEARHVLRQQARERNNDKRRALDAELQAELENIDRVLGL